MKEQALHHKRLMADAGFYTQAMVVNAVIVALTFLIFQFGYREKKG